MRLSAISNGLPTIWTSGTSIRVSALSSLPRALKLSTLFADSNTTVWFVVSAPGRSGTACSIIWTDAGANVTRVQFSVSLGTTCLQLGYVPSIPRAIYVQRSDSICNHGGSSLDLSAFLSSGSFLTAGSMRNLHGPSFKNPGQATNLRVGTMRDSGIWNRNELAAYNWRPSVPT